MKTLAKAVVAGTIPALIASQTLAAPADSPTTRPATQPATQPSTQPSGPLLVESNEPLVIPDGTSPQNPGPGATPFLRARFDINGNPMRVTGVRG